MNIKAIETQYKGYRFRSRLEARWAVFFDALGLAWEYEPEGFDLGDGVRYLPDFWLPELDCYAEVKPRQFSRHEWDKCNALSESCLLLDGVPAHCAWALTKGISGKDTFEWYLSGDEFGRVELSQSKYKGRIWFLFGENCNTYDEPTIAIGAALSARFEHGETPRI